MSLLLLYIGPGKEGSTIPWWETLVEWLVWPAATLLCLVVLLLAAWMVLKAFDLICDVAFGPRVLCRRLLAGASIRPADHETH